MERSRFDELMRRYPNWIVEGNEMQHYTFFDGHYVRKGVLEAPEEDADYILENDEYDKNLKIQLEASGDRYLVEESFDEEYPVLKLTPIDNTGNQTILLVPKNLQAHA